MMKIDNSSALTNMSGSAFTLISGLILCAIFFSLKASITVLEVISVFYEGGDG